MLHIYIQIHMHINDSDYYRLLFHTIIIIIVIITNTNNALFAQSLLMIVLYMGISRVYILLQRNTILSIFSITKLSVGVLL